MSNSFIHSFISFIQTIIYVKNTFLKIPCNMHLHEVIKNSCKLYKSTFYPMCHFFCFFICAIEAISLVVVLVAVY